MQSSTVRAHHAPCSPDKAAAAGQATAAGLLAAGAGRPAGGRWAASAAGRFAAGRLAAGRVAALLAASAAASAGAPPAVLQSHGLMHGACLPSLMQSAQPHVLFDSTCGRGPQPSQLRSTQPTLTLGPGRCVCVQPHCSWVHGAATWSNLALALVCN